MQFLCSAAEFLAMIPVAVLVYRVAARQMPQSRSILSSRSWMIFGVTALGATAILRLAAMVDPAVSDILFMVPLGLVGVWLGAVCWNHRIALPRWMRFLGRAAGLCLIGVSLNFLFNGGFAVFSKGPFAYANDVNFHIGLGLCGFPGFTLLAVWDMLFGLRLLRARPAAAL